MPCDILCYSEDDAITHPLPNTLAQMARSLSLAVEEIKYLFLPLFSVCLDRLEKKPLSLGEPV